MDTTKYINLPFFSLQLREKWKEIPSTRQGRVFSSEMLNWSDEKLLTFWDECREQTSVPDVRGWYQELYKDMFLNCEIADIGPGVGIDGIFFAQHGARVTFVDIVEDNLKLLKRICHLKGITANFYFINDFFDFHFENMFDVFLCIGSLINAPFDFTQKQAHAMTQFLRIGGKIVMLAYPKERYEISGARNFAEFGKMTDGERTPWCEWYDDEKTKALFGNNFSLNWSRNFGKDDIEFNWFDLTKTRDNVSISLNDLQKESIAKYSQLNPTGKWENLKGEYLFNKGDMEGSFSSFTKAVEIDPTPAGAYNNLGVWYWQIGNFEKAVNHFEKALEVNPNDRYTILNCIKILTISGKIEDAKRLYSDYLKQNKNDEEISQVLEDFELSQNLPIKFGQGCNVNIPIVSVKDLHKKLKFNTPINYPKASLIKPLPEWKMEIDDFPILRYVYRNFQPHRHLEFGTWQGSGVLCCLEECDATVWTINLPHGEKDSKNQPAYGYYPEEAASVRRWAKEIGLPEKDHYQTDSVGFIGRYYLEKKLGHRVCQIYCDGREWDISNYPHNFFDTILIDGGHTKDIVISDTRKAFQLIRDGGIVMWHDFCPPIFDQFESTRGVMEAIAEEWDWITSNTSQLFWIYPSWILLGVKIDASFHSKSQYLFKHSQDQKGSFKQTEKVLSEELTIQNNSCIIQNQNNYISISGEVPQTPIIGSDKPVGLKQSQEVAIHKPENDLAHTNELFAAKAYWNHRLTLAKSYKHIQALSEAVGHSADLPLHQWGQLMAFALEYMPDTILELGRGYGNSTCAFTEVANQLKPRRCQITSICQSASWNESLSNILQVVPKNWFDPLKVYQADIRTFDYQNALCNAQRILVFWDAHGFEVAECILGKILPLIVKRNHVVIIHDISDSRYSPASTALYGENSLWKGNNWDGPRLRLGDVDSNVEQAVSILDFTTRNNLSLFSADHSLHTEFNNDQTRVSELRHILGDKLFTLKAHWRWFSLNEKPGPFTFPKYNAPAIQSISSLTISKPTDGFLSDELLMRKHLGQILKRTTPISCEELQAAATTLKTLLQEADVSACLKTHGNTFPAATLPLLVMVWEKASNDSNTELMEILEHAYALLTRKIVQ